MTDISKNFSRFNQWLQIAVSVGVIASIVFLGLELRQNADLMKAQIYQSRAENFQDMFFELSESDYLVPIIEKIETAIAEGVSASDSIKLLTSEEKRRYSYFYERQVRHLDNMYYQYELGLIDEEYMSWWREIVRDSIPMWSVVFEDGIPGRDSFRDEVHRIKEHIE